ncbi:Rieske (2Fe-2S) protein [Streptomyces sp. NPDC001380]|uniref:Rieske (2Fe-2S) protein n=1 Tax=Streptomyces sp. NPDC001380 TaxID=3364566 RepID=UPI00368D7B02
MTLTHGTAGTAADTADAACGIAAAAGTGLPDPCGCPCGCPCGAAAAEAVPRRTALLAGVGLVAALAAGCAAGGGGTLAPAAPPSGGGQDGTGSPGAGSGSGAGAGAGSVGQVLVRTADLPVGGGVVVGRTYVVTQPRQGRFTAFSARCTNAGCPVEAVAGGTVNCPCHGSRFDIADGSVVHGPASRPLAPQAVTVSDGSVRLA